MSGWAPRRSISRLETVLNAFGFQVHDLFADLTSQPGRIWRFGVVPLRVEILTKISGVEFNDCYQRRLARDLDGITINLIDVADLRANKRASGRRKDLVDLDNLP